MSPCLSHRLPSLSAVGTRSARQGPNRVPWVPSLIQCLPQWVRMTLSAATRCPTRRPSPQRMPHAASCSRSIARRQETILMLCRISSRPARARLGWCALRDLWQHLCRRCWPPTPSTGHPKAFPWDKRPRLLLKSGSRPTGRGTSPPSSRVGQPHPAQAQAGAV